MAVKRKSRRRHNAIQASSDEGLEKAEQLAPLEERAGKSANQNSNNGGVITVDTGSLKLPKEFTEKEEEKSGLFGLEPVTIVILTFALAFIAFVAYLISIEPSKVNDEAATPAAESPR
jgi:hypothetical protein